MQVIEVTEQGTPCAVERLSAQTEHGGTAVSSTSIHRGLELEFTSDWFSHNTATWERVFSSKKWLNNGCVRLHVLEVGSWEGRSAAWLLTHLCCNTGSTLTAIDCWKGAAIYGARAKVPDSWSSPGLCIVYVCGLSCVQSRRVCLQSRRVVLQAFRLDQHVHSAEAVERRFDHNIAVLGATHKVVKIKDVSLKALAQLVSSGSTLYDVRGGFN